MGSVELHHAFMWICDECGRENFERAFSPSMSDEQRESLRVHLGVQRIGSVFAAPTVVQCKYCGEVFSVETEGE